MAKIKYEPAAADRRATQNEPAASGRRANEHLPQAKKQPNPMAPTTGSNIDARPPSRRNQLKLRAMTLTELLVVLAILGILVLMAFPVVMPLFQRARSTEAKLQLKHLCTLQKTFFLENARYGKDLKEIGFEQAPLDEAGGTTHYRIEIAEASNGDFLGRAVAVTDFDGDGQMNIWEVTESCTPKEVVED